VDHGFTVLGVNDLALENLTVWSTAHSARGLPTRITFDIRNVIVDTNNASSDGVHAEDSGTDGLHFSVTCGTLPLTASNSDGRRRPRI